MKNMPIKIFISVSSNSMESPGYNFSHQIRVNETEENKKLIIEDLAKQILEAVNKQNKGIVGTSKAEDIVLSPMMSLVCAECSMLTAEDSKTGKRVIAHISCLNPDCPNNLKNK